MKVLTRDDNIEATVSDSTTAKVLKIVTENMEAAIEKSRYLLKTGADEPIPFRYNLTMQAVDVEYALAARDGDTDNGDIIHGTNISNDDGLGIKPVIDAMQIFVGQFKRAMDEPDFSKSTPVPLEDAYELEQSLEPFFKALEICAVLALKNKK